MKQDRFDFQTLWILVRGLLAITALLLAFFLYVSNDTNSAMAAGAVFVVLFLNIMK